MAEFSFIKVGTSTGVRLSEWKGSLSLETGYQDKEGKIILEWVLGKHYDKESKQKVQDAKEKPLKIYLGNLERAEEVVKEILEQIRSLKGQGGSASNPSDDSEIPF